jgi:hypothetical protein
MGKGTSVMRMMIVACAFALALSGCATITRGTDEPIQVQSEPQGAQVQTSLGFQCITPCVLNVPRKTEFTVTYSKPGYEAQTIPVLTRMGGGGAAGLAGNVLVGGAIGIGVDVATGATLEHYPNPVIATLRPLAPPPGAPPRGRAKQPPVAQRPPAPPPIQPVAQAPAEPELSEQDRAMNSRN